MHFHVIENVVMKVNKRTSSDKILSNWMVDEGQGSQRGNQLKLIFGDGREIARGARSLHFVCFVLFPSAVCTALSESFLLAIF